MIKALHLLKLNFQSTYNCILYPKKSIPREHFQNHQRQATNKTQENEEEKKGINSFPSSRFATVIVAVSIVENKLFLE